MLSNGFAGPLRLQRKRSKLHAAYITSLHLLAVLALIQPINLPVMVLGILFVLLCFSALFHFRYFNLQQDESTFLIWQESGLWQYENEVEPYRLIMRKTVQTNWFVTLTLVNSHRERRLLVVRDQLEPDIFRKLRIRLKLHQDVTAAGRRAPV